MDYDSSNLLHNISYSGKLDVSFQQYLNVLNFSKGIIPYNVASIAELQTFGFIVDPQTNYIDNILDYKLYILDNNINQIHVVHAEQRHLMGIIQVVFNNDSTIKLTTTDIFKTE
ncbi:ORF16 protein [Operophtera brumata nucleopolyhedrovirus]|uniref:ORF16 protein n=1 Tax=Operophtera brumata nucleopolyhedrovirus TaxID=1046267 RepID=A0A2H4UZQ2_9ABAC|nr:ORF16 protein [Operophtera brumata nucleopolyhedrovirus]AUA60247.1 ORF16 protein [Operophtera brumata nucleopolyhedrovirus]